MAVARHPLLTPDEELHCARLIQAWLKHPDGPEACPKPIRRRGVRAKQRLIAGNLRLVFKLVLKWTFGIERSCGRVEADDLIQEGSIGLNRAAEMFDPEAGYKFSTYAYWWIMQGIRRHLEKQSWAMSITSNSPGDAQMMEKKAVELRAKKIPVNRETMYEAFEGKMSKYRIDGAFLFLERRYAKSLDATVLDDGNDLAESVAAPDAPQRNELAEELIQVMREFNRDLWAALELEHSEDVKPREIGALLGLNSYVTYRKDSNAFIKEFGDQYDRQIRECLAA